VLANLEDLWQATEPQNVPGTWRERPNWRRKAAHALEELDRLPGLVEALRALDRGAPSRPYSRPPAQQPE
jgi:4-alpha-glucanotransferase